MSNYLRLVKNYNVKAFFIITILSILMIMPQVYYHSIILGYDSLFHFNRFYDTAMQIKTGHYSYFMTLFGFNQSGRIVNALYGPVIAYINGYLLLIAGSWFKYQVFSGIILNIIAGYGFYKLSIKAGVANNIGLILSMAYINTYWITSWNNSQQFGAFGAALMPYVVLQGLSMIDKRNPDIKTIPLALSMAIMIQTHVLSAIFSVLVLIPFAIYGIYLTSHKARFLLHGILSVVLVLILTGNVWYTMLDLYHNNRLLSPFPQYNIDFAATTFSWGGDASGTLGIIWLVIFIVQIVLSLQRNQLVSHKNKLISYTGMLFLLASSSLLPWHAIGIHFPWVYSFLQFPFRLASVAVILLLIGFGLTLSNYQEINKKVNFKFINTLLLTIVAVLFIFNFQRFSITSQKWITNELTTSKANVIYKTTDVKQIRLAFRDKDLGKPFSVLQKGTSDYLPISKSSKLWDDNNFHPYNENIKATFFNPLKVTKSIDSHNQLILKWQGNSKKVVTLPVYKYADSKMSLNHRALDNSKVQTTVVGAVRVKQVKGKNTFKIGYQPSRTFRYMSGLTVISWFTLIGFGAIKLFKHIRFLLTKNMVLK